MALNGFVLNGSAVNDASALAWPSTITTSLINGTMLDVLPLNGDGTGTRTLILSAVTNLTPSLVKWIAVIRDAGTITTTSTLARVTNAIRSAVVTVTTIAPHKAIDSTFSVVAALTPSFQRVISTVKALTVALTPTISFPGGRAVELVATAITTTATVARSTALNLISTGITAVAARVVLTVGLIRSFNIFPVATLPKDVSVTLQIVVTPVVNAAADAIRQLVYKLAKFVTYVFGDSTNERTTYLEGDSRTTYTDDE